MLQKIEALLRAGLILALSDSQSDDRLRRLLTRDRETMGMLLRHMRDRVELPEDFADTLDHLLEKRNLFVHKLFLEDWFDLKTQEGLGRVNEFIADLLARGSVAVRVFIGYALARTKDGRSDLPESERDTFDRIILRIFSTATPDFGGKTPDEYLKNFTESVQNDYEPRIQKKTS